MSDESPECAPKRTVGHRPNLSKDDLAGGAPEDWLPLRPDG